MLILGEMIYKLTYSLIITFYSSLFFSDRTNIYQYFISLISSFTHSIIKGNILKVLILFFDTSCFCYKSKKLKVLYFNLTLINLDVFVSCLFIYRKKGYKTLPYLGISKFQIASYCYSNFTLGL